MMRATLVYQGVTGTMVYEDVLVRNWDEAFLLADERACNSLRQHLDGGVERFIRLPSGWVRL